MGVMPDVVAAVRLEEALGRAAQDLRGGLEEDAGVGQVAEKEANSDRSALAATLRNLEVEESNRYQVVKELLDIVSEM